MTHTAAIPGTDPVLTVPGAAGAKRIPCSQCSHARRMPHARPTGDLDDPGGNTMNQFRSFSFFALLAIGIGFACPGLAVEVSPNEFFETRIRPVLVEKCYSCHSAEAEKNGKLKGGLRVDHREGLLKGGDSGPAVRPGKVQEGTLLKALRHAGDFKMPPKDKLPETVISDFETWVKTGAADPRQGNASPTVAAKQIDWTAARQFWAFQAPVRSPLPRVREAAWPLREIDHFVLAAMEKIQLKPISAATRQTWIRRATFDLLGLPPTPAEIDAFIADKSSEAYSKVVERLLSSPHYGERWGRYWLDLARYTDDLGGTIGPVAAPNAFRYRDWVIRAFNRDLPYDQFIRLQLAGDLILEPATDYEERLCGLGFQGLGQRYSTNAVGMVAKKAADELDDRIDTVSRSLLGLTVSCARCHDHKFDPIMTMDYYSFASAYNGAELSTEITVGSPLFIAHETAAREQSAKDLAERKTRLAEATQVAESRIGRQELRRLDSYLNAAWKIQVGVRQKIAANETAAAKREQLNPVILSRLVKTIGDEKALKLPLLAEWNVVAATASKAALAKAGEIEVSAALKEQSEKSAKIMVEALLTLERAEVDEPPTSASPQDKKDKPKGQQPQKGSSPTLPKSLSADHQAILQSFLMNNDAPFRISGEAVIPFLDAEQRKQYDGLAAEIKNMQKIQPTAVIKAPGVRGGGKAMRVNIRGNAEVLGEQAPPGFLQVLRGTQPVAGKGFTRLDLAEAIANRGNPLTARVYVNRVWHYHFGRGLVGTLGNFGKLGDRPTHPELLDTLAVRFMESGWSTKWLHREIMLSATYRLDGNGDAQNAAKDPENLHLWRANLRRLDFEAWRDAMLVVSGLFDPVVGGQPSGQAEDPANVRRTVYSFISRFQPNPTLTIFDFPEPNVTSDRRHLTTSPQQQLFALNSKFTLAMAKAFAARIEKTESRESEQVQLAWQLAFGRLPDARETTLSTAFLRAANTGAGAGHPTNLQRLCHALLTSNEFTFVN
jgi:hypothetical protein